jgi:hypothetical protein
MSNRQADAHITENRVGILLDQVAFLIFAGLRITWIAQVQSDKIVAIIFEVEDI